VKWTENKSLQVINVDAELSDKGDFIGASNNNKGV
jgi:hypothetical protein